MCDLRVHGAFLFTCMVAWLCWHFRNFLWLHKVFSQTPLHFTSPFRSLEVISQSFRSPKVISQPKAIFAAKGHFRSCKIRGWGCEMALMCQRGVLQPISQLRNGGMGCKMALMCQGVVSQGVAMGLRNHFAAGTLLLQNHFAADGHFRKGLFWAAKFRIPLFSWF